MVPGWWLTITDEFMGGATGRGIKTTIKSLTGNMNPGFRTNTIRVLVVLMSAINTTFWLISFFVPGVYAHKVAGNLVDREPPVDSMHLLLFSGK